MILAQTTIVSQPPECTLYDPSPRQNPKTLDIRIAFNNLENPVAGCLHPVNQLASVAAIRLAREALEIFNR